MFWFQKEVTLASGLDLEEDFNRYIYGNPALDLPMTKSKAFRDIAEDPFHPKYTAQELLHLTMP